MVTTTTQLRRSMFSNLLPSLSVSGQQQPARIPTALHKDQVEWEYMTNVAGRLRGDSWTHIIARG
jgi:hypothetical protein